ncbi:nicotinamide-nucleotide amidohydrolase family protein [Chitinophaga pendula]|uniref:CinA family protein n=1 Tax=Chitinophaga TaxID=79328 RepID=UPI000BAEE8BB|nr:MULTISPECIES: nicotinamide-nucleotide amidohydrolase family protein [Chitinophaga]ASZ10590.1 damage-inducible protein CinA [Chitinophaga sp. MD30]UCJ06434.1 nicotinamide-nucleotide amidohydrolase family protein [Chitinophaga pendula]
MSTFKEFFIRNNLTIATAESVTAGQLQLSFSIMDGAVQFFQGGITAYNIGQKVKHLQVEPIHAGACNCVSEQVAQEMALHVCSLFNSSVGIAITGYAASVPELNIQEIFAYYAIVCRGQVVVSERITPAIQQPVSAVVASYADIVTGACLPALKRHLANTVQE